MDRTNADTAFRTMLTQYEDAGWEVRTLDATGLRATVRTIVQPQVAPGSEPDTATPLRLPACRRVWVDAAGAVQETNVPC